VMPVLESKCKSCHGTNGHFRITDETSTLSNMQTNQFLDTADAENSTLIQKAIGNLNHGGKAVITTSSTQYSTIKDWISEGALNN